MKRIKYIDALKFVAIASVIILHIAAIWDSTAILDTSIKNSREIFRFGVPLFIMITGMLTLNKEIDLDIFFKKKSVRIVYPLIFFFIISYLLNVYTNFLEVYWYCWMVIGVYLTIPIVNIFVKNAKENEMNYLILMIIITSIIYSLAQIYEIKLALDLDFFIGPTSYLILGYYLSKKEFNLSTNKIILISAFIFIIVSIYEIYFHNGLYWNNRDILISNLNMSFPHIVQSSSVLIFIKNLYSSVGGLFGKIREILESHYINNIILSFSRSSYGIYLVHMILYIGYIKPYFENIHMTGTNTLISIAILSVVLLTVSWLIIVILSRIPIINKFSGYY